MNFDRNTIFGFIALGLLFIGYFYYNTKSQQAYLKEKAQRDSIANIALKKADTTRSKTLPATDTSRHTNDTSATPALPVQGIEQRSTVENELAKFTFTSKGGQIKSVELKGFKAPDSNNVVLAGSEFDRISYRVNNGTGTSESKDLFFNNAEITKGPDGSSIVRFQLSLPAGSIVHQFVIPKRDYMVDFNIQATPGIFTDNTIPLTWQNRAIQLQRDANYEKTQSHISYREDDNFSDKSFDNGSSREFDEPVNWVSVKQQFFNTTLVAKNNFTSGSIAWVVPSNTADKTLADATANLRLKLDASGTARMSLYHGPNDYKQLKKYGNEMEEMVNLGSGIFAFVKYINRWIILPVWDFFRSLTSNYGIVILLLTFFIRLITSPLMYPSYLNAAKMKVLRPELDELKKKYPDQQAYAMEQMKFMREAGVNQIAGCLPGLLQIPIFFALYNFFNTNVALRGQNFLWADDLSQYDSIYNFGEIPLISSIYGNHVSLFTITAVITSFFISLYSMRAQPTQDNPVLKYMPYFFPIIMLFIFNNLPAALTWYYTVSNIITLLIQFVISEFVINHEKVIAKIHENRKKPKKKGWQERMVEMQEQQKQMQAKQQKRK